MSESNNLVDQGLQLCQGAVYFWTLDAETENRVELRHPGDDGPDAAVLVDVGDELLQQLQPLIDQVDLSGWLEQVRAEQSDPRLTGALVQKSKESHLGFLLTPRCEKLQMVSGDGVDDGGFLCYVVLNFQSLLDYEETLGDLNVLKINLMLN